MSDQSRRERLIDGLWPCPPPPPDLAERVMAAMQGRGVELTAAPGAAATAATARPVGSTAPRPRSPRIGLAVAVLSLSLSAAAALAVIYGPAEAEGRQVASARTTVTIAERAAAAMEPGADLTWSVRRKKVRVHQRQGSVFYRVDRGGPFRVVTPAGEVEVTGTCFRVTLGGQAALATSSTLVSVLEGSVKVGSGRDTLTVKAGEAVRLKKGRPPEPVPGETAAGPGQPESTPAGQTPPGAPDVEQELQARRAQELEELQARLRALEQDMAEQLRVGEPARRFSRPAALMLPAAKGLRVYGSGIERVSLTLPPAGKRGGGAALVEVARDAAFARRVFAGPVRTPFVTVPAPTRGELYWRRAGAGELHGHARFLPDQRRTVLDLRSPRNLVKEGAESTSVYFQGAPPALTLAFAPRHEARSYRVGVYRADQPARPLLERTTGGSRLSLAAGALPEGRYVWTVQPLDGQGGALGPVRSNRLELVYDNALDALAISRPRPAQKLSGRSVEVLGVAPLGARLFVNGKPAPLDDKGRFALKVTGAPRALVFRLLGKDGSESFWVRKLPSRS